MKELYINGQLVDLYPDTPVGLSIKSLDIADIESRSITHTNSFKIPPTPNNNSILGNSNSIYSASNTPYNKLIIDYVVDGAYVIDQGIGFLQNFDGDYNLSIYESGVSLIDILANTTVEEVIDNLSTVSTPNRWIALPSKTISDLFRMLIGTPLTDFFGVLIYNLSDDSLYSSGTDTIDATKIKPFIFVSYLFGLIESYLSISINGTVESDADFQNCGLQINTQVTEIFGSEVRLYPYNDTSAGPYYVKDDFSCLDLIKTIAQIYGCVIKFTDTTVTINVFDDILNNTPIDWSKKLVDNNLNKSFDIGYAQNNYIVHKVESGADTKYGATNIQSNNQNIIPDRNLFQLNNFYPVQIVDTNFYPD